MPAGWAVLGRRDTAHIWKVCWKGEFVVKAVTGRASRGAIYLFILLIYGGRGFKSRALHTLHFTVGPFALFVTAVQKNFTEGEGVKRERGNVLCSICIVFPSWLFHVEVSKY